MADLIAVENGCAPWKPAQSADLVKILNFYDMPLTGIVVQHDVPYLFHCIVGGGRGSSVWAYTSLAPGDEERFLGFEGAEFLNAVEQYIVTRDSVAAVADEERGIGWNEYFEPHKDTEGYLGTVRRRLTELVRDFSEAVSAADG